MNKLEQPSELDITQLSAQFIHDISTPLASLQLLASLLEAHLPAALSAYEQLEARGEIAPSIPSEQLLALQVAAANISTLAHDINQSAKMYWQQIDPHHHTLDARHAVVADQGRVSLSTPLNILVAEDDEIHQKIARRLLSPMHKVDVAANGSEAVDHCRRQHYDLVLMDLHMPLKDGVQAVAEIMCLPNPPKLVLGLTNRPIGVERKQLLQQGFSGFIEKPLRLDELGYFLEST
jgi:CheY-like chemotaxis protein